LLGGKPGFASQNNWCFELRFAFDTNPEKGKPTSPPKKNEVPPAREAIRKRGPGNEGPPKDVTKERKRSIISSLGGQKRTEITRATLQKEVTAADQRKPPIEKC